jgi:IS5 family transposase
MSSLGIGGSAAAAASAALVVFLFVGIDAPVGHAMPHTQNSGHPLIKRQFGHVKVRYRGLKKNTAQLKTLFALSNLWMARGKLAALDG